LTDEMEDMHKRVDPQEEEIPTLIAPYETDDSVPTEDEITLAVKRLKSGKPPGASKMTAAHLKKWCRQAPPLTEEDVPQPEAWNKLRGGAGATCLGTLRAAPRALLLRSSHDSKTRWWLQRHWPLGNSLESP